MPRKVDKPATGSERVAKHRLRERERDLQIALAAGRMVLGKDVGDATRALAAFLKKQSKRDDLPEDYSELLVDAAEKLARRRR